MEIPRHWRLKKQRYALMDEVCLTVKQRYSRLVMSALSAMVRLRHLLHLAGVVKFILIRQYITHLLDFRKHPLTWLH